MKDHDAWVKEYERRAFWTFVLMIVVQQIAIGAMIFLLWSGIFVMILTAAVCRH